MNPPEAVWCIPWITLICCAGAITIFLLTILGPPKGPKDPPDDSPLDPPP